jgi:ureidoacrylate peracid hydrolase
MMPEMLIDKHQRFDPKRTTLLIIDMQKDFCLEGYGAQKAGRDLTAARQAIPKIRMLLDAARRHNVHIVHVGFWTLPDHASDSGPWLVQRRRSTASADNLCMADTPGAEFVDELAPAAGEAIVHKHRYSAFTGTNLDLLLRARGTRSLVITGVSTNACIESTLRAGFELDYYICVPPDAVGSWNQDLHAATLANVDHRFGVTLSTRDLLEIWGAAIPEHKDAP